VDVDQLDSIHANVYKSGNLLIKIDVQGFEKSVLSGAKNLISDATLIIVETSFRVLYEGQALFAEIYQMLVEAGFVYIGSQDQLYSPLDGSILQQDAIFLNSRKRLPAPLTASPGV
jgi:hypothetical protein